MQLSYPIAFRNQDRQPVAWVRAVTLVACGLFAGLANAKSPIGKSQDFNLVVQAIDSYFATLPDYQAGDLISQSQIAAAIDAVEKAGWQFKDAESIVKRGLADNSFLIRELSAPAGKKFMRKIAGQPGSFAHLDRLSTISRGQQTVRDLVRQPGGDELIKYMTTTSGGHKLGSMMSGVQHGVDLNKPTKRIYTADDLIAALQHTPAKQAK